MGNTTVKRHNSGEDTGLNVTAVRKHPDSLTNSFSLDDDFKQRSHSNTLSPRPQVDKLSPKHLPTVFKWEGGGNEVFLAGSFNNWQKNIPLSKSHGDFYTILDIPEGQHEYKFLVDGKWDHNETEPTVMNDLGSINNVVSVKRSDFEVFEALDLDSRSTSMKHSEVAGSPPGEYSQEIPTRKYNEKHSGPPILPPHLLEIILNKDTPAHCEPTFLPEPNHVMLNHLYALSIKDGVIVLSVTHRFRKKYVTTLLYRPID